MVPQAEVSYPDFALAQSRSLYSDLSRGLLLAGALLGGGCAAPYTVRTAGKGHTVVHASFGGPLIGNIGGAVPVPAVVLGAKYGLTDDWDVHGAVHLLPTAFRTPGIDVGITRRLLKERGAIPEITATLRLPLLTDFRSARVYPELEAYASYLLRRRALLYLGMTTLFDFFWDRDPHVKVHFGPVIGADVRFRQRYSMGLALRWISPQEDYGSLVVDYISPGKLGMFMVQLGFQGNLSGWP